MNEARAGKVQADVFDGIDTTPPLLKAGLVDTVRAVGGGQISAELKDPKGRWNALMLYFLTPAINTKLVQQGARCQDRAGPAQSEMEGQDRLEHRAVVGLAASIVGSMLQTMGEEKGMAFLRALAKQNIVNVDATNRAILDQVILGQYAIALSIFNHHALLSARKGAPVHMAQARADLGADPFDRPGQERAAS